jgi:hypothetical protein
VEELETPLELLDLAAAAQDRLAVEAGPTAATQTQTVVLVAVVDSIAAAAGEVVK